jgi:hypothetical protein
MTNEECFAIWAPDGVVWSQWAKPVTFTQLNRASTPDTAPPQWEAPEVRSVPSPGRTAVIVDAPGPNAVRLGIALARIGYRPVPLFNATTGYAEVLDIDPIAHHLLEGAPLLQDLRLPADAPPAFLLDAQRMNPQVLPYPGKFDNRWMTLPQDFPSATMLRAHGVVEALLLRHSDRVPDQDLAHVLRRWQDAGVRITIGDLATGGEPQPYQVERPSLFRRAWYRAVALMGLRRNDVGGFGSAIPEESTGGGGFGGFG